MVKRKFPAVPVAILGTVALGVGIFALRKVQAEEPTPTNPVLIITSDVGAGIFPLTVNFAAAGSGGSPPYEFAWSFGDGGSEVGQNVSHTFESPGNFSVQCTLMDSEGRTKIKSLSINVQEPGTEPDPIKPGDVSLVLITENNFSFVSNLSNLRSDIDATGTLTFILSRGSEVDRKTVSVTIPASGGLNEVYTIPSNLAAGDYTLEAKFETDQLIGNDTRQFTIKGDEPPPGGDDPTLGDVTLDLEFADNNPGFDDFINADLRNVFSESLSCILRHTLRNSSGQIIDTGSVGFTLGPGSTTRRSFNLGELPPGNYSYNGKVSEQNTEIVLNDKDLNFTIVEDTPDPIVKMSMNWKRLDCFAFNPSINAAWDLICGGTVELHNQGNVPIEPILELFVDVSAPGQNEVINLALVFQRRTIQPGQRVDIDFNLPEITLFSPANVINTLEVREQNGSVLDSAVKSYILREDGVIVKT